jgi:hypothetical protein
MAPRFKAPVHADFLDLGARYSDDIRLNEIAYRYGVMLPSSGVTGERALSMIANKLGADRALRELERVGFKGVSSGTAEAPEYLPFGAYQGAGNNLWLPFDMIEPESRSLNSIGAAAGATAAAGGLAALGLSDDAEASPSPRGGTGRSARINERRLERLHRGELTPDESYTLSRLDEGTDPTTIADEMQISDNHLSQLLWRLREAGHDVPLRQLGRPSNVRDQAVDLKTRFPELTNAQIAERIGSTTDSVKVTLFNARRHGLLPGLSGAAGVGLGLSALSGDDAEASVLSSLRDDGLETAPWSEMGGQEQPGWNETAADLMRQGSGVLPFPFNLSVAASADFVDDPIDAAAEYAVGSTVRQSADSRRQGGWYDDGMGQQFYVEGDPDFRAGFFEEDDNLYQQRIMEDGQRGPGDMAWDRLLAPTELFGGDELAAPFKAGRGALRALRGGSFDIPGGLPRDLLPGEPSPMPPRQPGMAGERISEPGQPYREPFWGEDFGDQAGPFPERRQEPFADLSRPEWAQNQADSLARLRQGAGDAFDFDLADEMNDRAWRVVQGDERYFGGKPYSQEQGYPGRYADMDLSLAPSPEQTARTEVRAAADAMLAELRRARDGFTVPRSSDGAARQGQLLTDMDDLIQLLDEDAPSQDILSHMLTIRERPGTPAYPSLLQRGSTGAERRNQPIGSSLDDAMRLDSDALAAAGLARDARLAVRQTAPPPPPPPFPYRAAQVLGGSAAGAGILAATASMDDPERDTRAWGPERIKQPPYTPQEVPPLPEHAGAAPREEPIFAPVNYMVPTPDGRYMVSVNVSPDGRRIPDDETVNISFDGAEVAPDPRLFDEFEVDPANLQHVRRLQNVLIEAGFDVGRKGADGVLGDDTQAAIDAIASAYGYGAVDPTTAFRLAMAYPTQDATVGMVQSRLAQNPDFLALLGDAGPDDVYGPDTERAVEAFTGRDAPSWTRDYAAPPQEFLNETYWADIFGNKKRWREQLR